MSDYDRRRDRKRVLLLVCIGLACFGAVLALAKSAADSAAGVEQDSQVGP